VVGKTLRASRTCTGGGGGKSRSRGRAAFGTDLVLRLEPGVAFKDGGQAQGPLQRVGPVDAAEGTGTSVRGVGAWWSLGAAAKTTETSRVKIARCA
jgi:hypothetical protein